MAAAWTLLACLQWSFICKRPELLELGMVPHKTFCWYFARIFLVWEYIMLIFNLGHVSSYRHTVLVCERTGYESRCSGDLPPLQPGLQTVSLVIGLWWRLFFSLHFHQRFFSSLALWKFSFPASHLEFVWAQSLTPAPQWVLKPQPFGYWDQQPFPHLRLHWAVAALPHTVHILIFQTPLCFCPLGT